MNSQQIEAFLAVVRNRSMSAAALELFIAQPTVSHRIQLLEKEMGSALFKRSKGKKEIELTTMGKEFLGIAEHWNALWQEARALQTKGPKLSLRVGAANSFNTYLFPPLYRMMTRYTPSVQLEIQTRLNSDLYTDVAAMKLDVAYVYKKIANPYVLAEPHFTSKMGVLRVSAPGDSPPGKIEPEALDPDYEIYKSWGQPFEAWHEKIWNSPRLSRIQVNSAGLLINLLDQPAQWAIVPEWLAQHAMERGGFTFFHLSDPPPNCTCYKIVHSQATSKTLAVIALLDTYLKRVVNKSSITG